MSKPIPTLESLAVQAYLLEIQDICAQFVRLAALNSKMLSQVMTNLLVWQKKQLNDNLHGTASSSIRQQMIETIMSGAFPTKNFHNSYEPLYEPFNPTDLNFEVNVQSLNEMRQCGRKCSSFCCTGAFIVETMLAVIVNEDVRELNFDTKNSKTLFFNRNKIISSYVSFQVPAILAHYTKCIKDSFEKTTAKLERLCVKGTQIPSRQLAARKNHFEVLARHKELEPYLEVPGILSQAADGKQYGGYSEHLILALGDLFSLPDSFPKLTEIVLGREACNTTLKMNGSYDISRRLFRGIGIACPNLKILNVSDSFSLTAECVLFLFFHDTYHSLHRYVYMPQILENFDDKIVQNDECDLDEIKHHSELSYCPWCLDDWCANGLRQGLEWSDIETPVIDERIYNGVKLKYGDEAKKYLINVITATDLVKSVDSKAVTLVRPPGPCPWEPNFKPEPQFEDSAEKDYNYYWRKPLEWEARYEEAVAPNPINPIAKSLQVLKLNVDPLWPKYEIVPFLLKVMPKIKSLGHVNVLKGLKMMQGTLGLEGIKAESLEEIDFGFGGSMSSISGSNWADNEIVEYVEDFSRHLFDNYSENPDEKREHLRNDVELVASQCRKLKKMEVFLYGEVPCLREHDVDVWLPFKKLADLKTLSLFAHEWRESVALFKAIGKNLVCLTLFLDGRGHMSHVNNQDDYVPKLDQMLEVCPNLTNLSLAFGVKRVHISDQAELDDKMFPNLKQFHVQTYMTQKAFLYIWDRAPNLEDWKAHSLSVTNQFPQGNSPNAIFDQSTVSRLFSKNKMQQLKSLDVQMSMDSIESASQLITGLKNTTKIGTLTIKVGMNPPNVPNQEEMILLLNQTMGKMKVFQMFCAERKKLGQVITYQWERFGFLEGFGDIENLPAFQP